MLRSTFQGAQFRRSPPEDGLIVVEDVLHVLLNGRQEGRVVTVVVDGSWPADSLSKKKKKKNKALLHEI